MLPVLAAIVLGIIGAVAYAEAHVRGQIPRDSRIPAQPTPPRVDGLHGGAHRTVLRTVVIGHSVSGRPIRAFEVGDPWLPTSAVAMAAIHGDEPAGAALLDALVHGPPVHDVHLWLIPTANPDGLALGRRENARGVDLNRNFPVDWAPAGGRFASGPRPGSEPETQALMRFLSSVRPVQVVSFHQPYDSVDLSEVKTRSFAERLATDMRIPVRSIPCNGACHGTLTQWFNATQRGDAVTVELGPNPSARLEQVVWPRALLRALGGRW